MDHHNVGYKLGASFVMIWASFKTITLVYTGISFSMGDYPKWNLLNTIKCSVEILASFKTIQGIYIIYCQIKFFQDHLDIRLVLHGKQHSI